MSTFLLPPIVFTDRRPSGARTPGTGPGLKVSPLIMPATLNDATSRPPLFCLKLGASSYASSVTMRSNAPQKVNSLFGIFGAIES
eukprot:740860-Prymnesium_polylepis.1